MTFNKTISHQWALIGLLGLVIPVSHATSQPFQNNSLVITLSAGPTWGGDGDTQTFFVQPSTVRTYTANQQTHGLADGEIFMGFQHTLSNLFQGQLGLAVASTTNANFSGNIWDDANPTFNNFNYHYQVMHSHIAVKGKLLADLHLPVTPYISGSLGVGVNQAGDFTNTPTIPEAVSQPNFMDHNTTAFTYTIGVGFQYPLTEHSQIGLGYEFADWGHSSLAAAPGQTLGSGLAFNHFYTNGLLFNISYQA